MYNLNRVVGRIEISVENKGRTSVTGDIDICRKITTLVGKID